MVDWEHPAESPAFLAAVVRRLADSASGRVQVDPRPLRADADLAGIGDDDLVADAEEVTRLRTDALASRRIRRTDAVADFRCTFSAGVGPVPGREAALPDSVRQRRARCLAREPYTTLIFGLPDRAAERAHSPETWQIVGVAMTTGGFRVWDLYLQPQADGSWRVVRQEPRLVIWS